MRKGPGREGILGNADVVLALAGGHDLYHCVGDGVMTEDQITRERADFERVLAKCQKCGRRFLTLPAKTDLNFWRDAYGRPVVGQFEYE